MYNFRTPLKKMVNLLVVVLLVAVWGYFNFSCSSNVCGGFGSETNNGMVSALLIDGSANAPAKSATIELIPADFNPSIDSDSLIITTLTNDSGVAIFDSVNYGKYNIIARSADESRNALYLNVSVNSKETIYIEDTLKSFGTIKVILPSNVSPGDGGYVYIEGTDIYKKADSTVVFLDFVPAGSIPKIVFISDKEDIALIDSMTVVPNDTIIQTSVLFITNKKSGLDTVSLFIAEKLKMLGLSVKMITDSVVSPADTAGMSAVIFSSTAYARPRLGTIFRDMPLPLLNMEFSLLKHVGMTDTAKGVDYGRLLGVECDISDSSHSIAGGLLGVVTMYSDSSGIEWGKPGTGAQKIAVLPGTIDSAAIFCYENDAEMVGMKAPAKRGAFLLHGDDANKLTNDGWYLFRNMVKWLFE